MAANTGWIYAAIGGTTCVSTRRSAHTGCCCEDRVRTLQIHRYVGPVRPEPLACGLANRRNSRPITPISAVLPGKLRLPANDRSENRRSTVLDSPSSRTTHAGRPGLSFPRPKLTERFAILLKILHGEVVDFVLL